MDFEELLRFINKEDKRIREMFGNYSDEDKRVLARTVKLTEEVGELSSTVLGSMKMQRPSKQTIYSQSSVDEEFADVMITLLLLAKAMDIDISSALSRKIDVIESRHKQ